MTWLMAWRVSTTYGNPAHNTTTSSANFFVRFFNCSLIFDQFVVRTSAFAIRNQGLVAEVAAVDEEEDAACAGEFDEAVNEVDGGVGLAAAGGHLDEGAAFVGGEGFLEVVDGFDLRGPQIGGRHLICSEKVGQAGV